MEEQPPDVIVLGGEWPERALLRAQLIEEGHDVVALDAWPIPRQYRRAGMKPRAMVVDLRGLEDPRLTLDELRFVIPPERVLVVTALGTLPRRDVERFGFRTIERPATVGEIVGAVSALLAAKRALLPATQSKE
jgi:hypothetical protein